MRRPEALTYLLPWLLLVTAGCESRLTIGAFERGGSGGGNTGDAGGDRDASRPTDGSLGMGDAAGGCNSEGPLLRVGDGPGPTCGGGASSRQFRYAACSCDDLATSADLTVDAFGTGTSARLSNGSLGVNRSMYPLTANVAGSVVVAGPDGIPTQGDLTIGGDLSDQGQLDGQVDVRVDGDAEVGGDVRVKSLTLGGALRVSTESAVDVADGNPAFTAGSVSIEPPCDCEAGPDLVALVEAARDANDNQAAGIDPAESLRSLNGPLELTLPCGRYYVDTIYAPNPITLTITGHVTLYVGGDVVTVLGGALRVQLAPGAELDLVIQDNLSAGDLVELGSSATPGRVRVYAGGKGTLFFAGNTTLAGTLYAPAAELVSSGTFELYGAMLVRRMSSSGNVLLHYDRSLTLPNCP